MELLQPLAHFQPWARVLVQTIPICSINQHRISYMPNNFIAFPFFAVMFAFVSSSQSEPAHRAFVVHARLGTQGRLGNQMFQW
jgi:hypothetical protein